MTDTSRMKAILVATATIAFVASPWASGQFGGFDPDRFPVPQVDPPIQPAGYAFSIWGLIYLWLLVHAAFGLFQRAEDPDWDAPRWPLFVSLAVGAAWIPVAQASPVWAMILILVMLGGVLGALFVAPRQQPMLCTTPLSIYAGWLTAASFVSIAVNAAGYGIWFGAMGWAWIAVVVLCTVGTVLQLRLGSMPGFGLAIAWALIGVAVQNGAQTPGFAAVAMLGAIGFIGLAWLVTKLP